MSTENRTIIIYQQHSIHRKHTILLNAHKDHLTIFHLYNNISFMVEGGWLKCSKCLLNVQNVVKTFPPILTGKASKSMKTTATLEAFAVCPVMISRQSWTQWEIEIGSKVTLTWSHKTPVHIAILKRHFVRVDSLETIPGKLSQAHQRIGHRVTLKQHMVSVDSMEVVMLGSYTELMIEHNLNNIWLLAENWVHHLIW